MKDGESERIVQLYLQQRGYRATEAAFKSESRTLGLEEIAFEVRDGPRPSMGTDIPAFG